MHHFYSSPPFFSPLVPAKKNQKCCNKDAVPRTKAKKERERNGRKKKQSTIAPKVFFPLRASRNK